MVLGHQEGVGGYAAPLAVSSGFLVLPCNTRTGQHLHKVCHTHMDTKFVAFTNISMTGLPDSFTLLMVMTASQKASFFLEVWDIGHKSYLPWIGRQVLVSPSVWAYTLRNPLRLSISQVAIRGLHIMTSNPLDGPNF